MNAWSEQRDTKDCSFFTISLDTSFKLSVEFSVYLSIYLSIHPSIYLHNKINNEITKTTATSTNAPISTSTTTKSHRHRQIDILPPREGSGFRFDIINTKAVHIIRYISPHELVLLRADALNETSFPTVGVVVASTVKTDADKRSGVDQKAAGGRRNSNLVLDRLDGKNALMNALINAFKNEEVKWIRIEEMPGPVNQMLINAAAASITKWQVVAEPWFGLNWRG